MTARKPKNYTILCDVDEVCAGLMSEWIRIYNHKYMDELDHEKINDWDLTLFVKPECGRKVYDLLADPDLYDDVRPVNNALWGIQKLHAMGHRIIFVSSSHPGGAGRKAAWLRAFGFLEYSHGYVEAHASDKRFVSGDIMIDDRPLNLEHFMDVPYDKRGSRFAILFDAPHNQTCTEYNRATGWAETVRIITAITTGKGYISK